MYGTALAASTLIAGAAATAIGTHRYEARTDSNGTSVVLPHMANAAFQGTRSNGVESFLNIRFGADTSKKNRFAPPVPYTYASGTYDASQPGAACPQQQNPLPDFPLFSKVNDMSEDCLTLRVDRPAGTTADDNLPVMVYIYGGGDTIGQIYDHAYDPTGLVTDAAEKGYPVIYAAMNYRVGILGFAATDALRAADSLNAGLLDQRLGLEWIQQHIAAFGGDPRRVTIFGESDGATGVGLQITAYGGDVECTPFQRAIMESGGPTADAGTAGNFSLDHTQAVIKLANCTAATSEQELACLRALPLSTLLPIAISYELRLEPFGGFDIFIPTAPSTFIPDAPSRLLYTGRFAHDIDIVSGWNEDDGSVFTNPINISTDADVLEFLATSLPGLTNASAERALQLYPVSDFPSDAAKNVSAQWFRASRMTRDSQYTCSSLLLTQMNAKYSKCSTANYLFALNQTVFSGVLKDENSSYLGVTHFSDIPFVFDQVNTEFAALSTDSDKTLGPLMSGSWASFAAFGQVSGHNGTLRDWPGDAYHCCPRDEAANVRIIGGPNSGLKTVNQYEHIVARCALWNSPEVAQEIQV